MRFRLAFVQIDVLLASFLLLSVWLLISYRSTPHLTLAFTSPAVNMNHSSHHAHVSDEDGGGEGMGDGGMGMQMTFYNSVKVTLWFDAWTTSTLPQYLVLLSGLVLFAVAHEALSAYRAIRLASLLQQSSSGSSLSSAHREGIKDPLLSHQGDAPSATANAPSSTTGGPGGRSPHKRHLHFQHKALLGSLYALQLLTAYLLMLAVMTYNVGCILAVVAGVGIGYVVFFDLSPVKHLGRGESCHLTELYEE